MKKRNLKIKINDKIRIWYLKYKDKIKIFKIIKLCKI